jgi:hypothetical protein
MAIVGTQQAKELVLSTPVAACILHHWHLPWQLNRSPQLFIITFFCRFFHAALASHESQTTIILGMAARR